MLDVAQTFVWGEFFEDGADGSPSCLDCSWVLFAQQRFDLGEDLFDWVEVGAVGRQEDHPGTGGPDRLSNLDALVAAKIVEHDDVAGAQGWDEDFADIAKKALAVDRPVEDAGCDDPVVAQRRHQGERLPVAVRHLGNQSLAAGSPSPQPGHVRLDPGFVDEHKAFAVDQPL
jgi:hypothetical protein